MDNDRRAALVEKANTAYYRAGTMATPEERMSAAVSLIRAEVLEEAARVAADYARHEVAAAIRALKEKQ